MINNLKKILLFLVFCIYSQAVFADVEAPVVLTVGSSPQAKVTKTDVTTLASISDTDGTLSEPLSTNYEFETTGDNSDFEISITAATQSLGDAYFFLGDDNEKPYLIFANTSATAGNISALKAGGSSENPNCFAYPVTISVNWAQGEAPDTLILWSGDAPSTEVNGCQIFISDDDEVDDKKATITHTVSGTPIGFEINKDLPGEYKAAIYFNIVSVN